MRERRPIPVVSLFRCFVAHNLARNHASDNPFGSGRANAARTRKLSNHDQHGSDAGATGKRGARAHDATGPAVLQATVWNGSGKIKKEKKKHAEAGPRQKEEQQDRRRSSKARAPSVGFGLVFFFLVKWRRFAPQNKLENAR